MKIFVVHFMLCLCCERDKIKFKLIDRQSSIYLRVQQKFVFIDQVYFFRIFSFSFWNKKIIEKYQFFDI